MEKKNSIAQEVLLRIQEDIITGEIHEGETITERWLEQKYGVSRTPIKEALKQLSIEGWVEIAPRQETRVTRFGIEELKEAMPIRISLETIAVHFCMQRMNSEKRLAFEKLLSEFENLDSVKDRGFNAYLDEYNRLDNEFHKMICDNSESRLLLDFNTRLRSLLKRTYRKIPLDEGRIEIGKDELKNVLKAILSNDIVTADANMTKHVINSISHKIKILEQREQSSVDPK